MGGSRKSSSGKCSNANTSSSGSGAKKHSNWTETFPCEDGTQHWVAIAIKYNEMKMLSYWTTAGGAIIGIAALGVATGGTAIPVLAGTIFTCAMPEISHGAVDIFFECRQCLGRFHATFECGFDGKFMHWGFYKDIKCTKSRTQLSFNYATLQRIFGEMWDQNSYNWLSKNGKDWAAEFMDKLMSTTTNDDVAQQEVNPPTVQTLRAAAATKEQNQCIICLEGERQLVFDPCGHMCVCRQCATRIGTNCPYCRQPIRKQLQVFHP